MGRVQLNVWVEEGERDAIKARAAEAGVPVGRLVVEAVLGSTQEPLADAVARDRADHAVDRVVGVENAFEDLERRLSRLEGMAGGSSY